MLKIKQWLQNILKKCRTLKLSVNSVTRGNSVGAIYKMYKNVQNHNPIFILWKYNNTLFTNRSYSPRLLLIIFRKYIFEDLYSINFQDFTR